MAEWTDLERQSLEEIPHPSLGAGANLYGSTKLFPDHQAEDGESYLLPGRAEHRRCAQDLHRGGRQGLLLPLRPARASAWRRWRLWPRARRSRCPACRSSRSAAHVDVYDRIVRR